MYDGSVNVVLNLITPQELVISYQLNKYHVLIATA